MRYQPLHLCRLRHQRFSIARRSLIFRVITTATPIRNGKTNVAKRYNRDACVAMPDPILGEAVAAFLVPEPGASMPVLQTILPMLAGKLEKFKQPKRLYRIDALPRTVSGKLQRNALKEYL